RFPLAIALGNEFLAENCMGRGDWDRGLAFAQLDHEQATKIGSRAREAWAGFCRAQAFQGKGDLAQARAATLACIALCDQIGEHRLAAWLEPLVAAIAADVGDDEAARAHAQSGWDRARPLNQIMVSAWALNALGYTAMQRSDVPSALAWFEQYVELVRDTENQVARSVIMPHAAEAFLL